MNKSAKVLILAVIITLIVGAIFLRRPLQRFVMDVLTDNKELYLSCGELPTTEKVEATFTDHADTVQEINSIGNISIVHSENCMGKSYVEIQYGSHGQRNQIEKIIGDTFFGIPWRGVNT